MQLAKSQGARKAKHLAFLSSGQFIFLEIWNFDDRACIWDDVFYLWRVPSVFLRLWGFVYPSWMDLWIDPGKYIPGRSLSGGDALLHLLYAYDAWHQSVQHPLVLTGNPCGSIPALGLSSSSQGVLLAVYATFCADAFFDAGSE